jgi:Gluconate 2-dehydrogenase subunit 3
LHFDYIHIAFSKVPVAAPNKSSMNRRTVLKKLAITSGAIIILPQWMGCGNGDTPATHTSSFSSKEQELLAAITDTIIPAGNSIGALSVGVDKFLQKLLDDCYEKDVRDNVKAQLKALESSAQSTNKKTFADCTQVQRQELLLKFSVSQNKAEKDFFTLIKSETIRGFNTSQKVMEDYLGYKVAPGHYYGCINVNTKA